MAPTFDLHILCPTYFDVESFLRLRDDVVRIVDDSRTSGCLPIGRLSFVVVDDAATRDPAAADLQALPDVTVVTPPFNLGHQRAIVYGLRFIAARIDPDDLVVTMDSDGEDQPQDIPALVEALLAEASDPWRVVVARRTHRRERLSFKAMYFGFRILFRTLTGTEIRSGNYAAFRGLYVRNMLDHPYFDLCYSSSLISLNPGVVTVPCARGTRYAGESRMSTQSLLNHGVRMLMPFADRIAVRSLAFFTLTATLTLVLLVVAAVGNRLGGIEVPAWFGWALAACAVGSSVALLNFLVLFSVSAQTSALSLQRIDPTRRGHDGTT